MRKLRWLPMKSITVRASLPSLRRRPRPSCWRNTTGDSVGRSIRTVSISGTSRPSLNTSTVQMTCSSPARSCSTEPTRGALVGPLCTATAATPLLRKNSAVKSAWVTVTQNAMVRPPPLSRQTSRACWARSCVSTASVSAAGSNRPPRQGIGV